MDHFKILIHEHYGKNSLASIRKDLTDLGLNVNINEHNQSGPYLCLDWILSTGIILFILKPYIETFLRRAAEDHYDLLKNFIKKKLYKNVIQPEEEFKIVFLDGTEKDTIFTMHFSIIYRISNNQETVDLKLMFPKKCTAEYFTCSIISFINYLKKLDNKNELENLFDKINTYDIRGIHGTQILWYNEEKKEIEFLDIIESSKIKKIVTKDFA